MAFLGKVTLPSYAVDAKGQEYESYFWFELRENILFFLRVSTKSSYLPTLK